MTETINALQVPTGIKVPAPMQEAQERLLSRFHPENPPQASRLQAVINNESSALIFALLGDETDETTPWQATPSERYVGTLTLIGVESTTRLSGYIEHVVVDEAYEGRGIGGLLVAKALVVAESKNASRVDLTSNASKEAAQRLYEKMGFRKRETNNWRYEF